MYFLKIDEAIDWLTDIQDKFIDGKCSKCGECCGRYLPISEKEVKTIKRYVKGKQLKIPQSQQANVFGLFLNYNCPFMDTEAKEKCQIYPVRPEICKHYTCRNHVQGNFKPISHLSGRKLVDMYKVFGFN